MTAGTAGAFAFGAFAGSWIGRAVFKWVLGVSGTWAIVLILTSAAIGAALGVVSARQSRDRA